MSTDIFSGIRLLKRIGLKEQARELAQKSESIKDLWGNGYEFVWGIFDAATETGGEKAIYEFLAGPFEMTPADVEKLEVAKLMAMFKQLVAENDLVTFFKTAADLTK